MPDAYGARKACPPRQHENGTSPDGLRAVATRPRSRARRESAISSADDPTSALNPRQGRRADDESARDRAIGRVRVHGAGVELGEWRRSTTCRQRTGRCRSKRTVCFSAQQTGESRLYMRTRQLCVCTAPRGARSGAMGTAHPRRIAVPSEGRSGRPQANLAPGLLSRISARARRARAVVRGACVALGSWAGRAPR